MEKETLKKAIKVYEKINELKDKKSSLLANANPSSGIEIRVKQCYGDMGKSFENFAEFDEGIANELFNNIIDIIEQNFFSWKKSWGKYN